MIDWEKGRVQFFRERLDNNTRLISKEVYVGLELIDIRSFIERKIDNSWQEIGHMIVTVDENGTTARIQDTLIGTRNDKYAAFDKDRNRPPNIEEASRFRRRGLGSKTVL